MNDPHVTGLHYWVEHDDFVDYEQASTLEFENDLLQLRLDKRWLTIKPQDHYANEEEAKGAVEGFVRSWEFNAALDAGTSRFSLKFLGADLYDRNPPPAPPGVQQVAATFRAVPMTSQVHLRLHRGAYPTPPTSTKTDPDDPAAKAMLSRLDRYHQGRETLAAMAYFCLTMLENNVPTGEGNDEKRASAHFTVSRKVLNTVSRLSSEKGGPDARKGGGAGQDFTAQEREFLLAAVKAFIRRVAEKAANPEGSLERITLAGLPSLPKKK